MTIDMSQFYEAFFEEADELLAQTEHLLLAIDIDAPDQDHLDAIFRASHSIKGGAATFGFNHTTEITHILENLLDQIRSHELQLTQEHIDTLLFAKDVVSSQLQSYRNGQEPDPQNAETARIKLETLTNGHHIEVTSTTPVTPTVAEAPKTSEVKTQDTSVENSQQPETAALSTKCYRIELLKINTKDIENLKAELSLLGNVELIETESKKVIFQLTTTDSTENILSICSFVVDETDLIIKQIESNPIPDRTPPDLPQEPLANSSHPLLNNHQNQQATSIRVGIEKVDQLINLIGELVITQAMIEQHVQHLDASQHSGLFNSINQLTRNTKDLQEAVMSIRMMPMDYVFSRFPRMVKDLATKLDKKIDFVTEGAATELDKGLIERIIDPLTHLVRNSIDHGIEHPYVRQAAGKRETGRLALSASNRGGSIVIEVTDDGAGLNRAKILKKAREHGMNVSDEMKDSEVWKLIFAPGFSTAEVVTEVSGRGVGMDVVKRNVNALGGAIQIRSKAGQGTVMSISMPLTLAIMDGMSVALGENIFILPLNTIVETLQPSEKDIKSVTGEGLMIQVRGEYLPIIALHNLFDYETNVKTPTQGVLVIIETEGHKAAILVDRLVGQQQVVIKSLETNFKKIPGISGATIMGDGTVALILDATEIIELGQHNRPQGIYQ